MPVGSGARARPRDKSSQENRKQDFPPATCQCHVPPAPHPPRPRGESTTSSSQTALTPAQAPGSSNVVISTTYIITSLYCSQRYITSLARPTDSGTADSAFNFISCAIDLDYRCRCANRRGLSLACPRRSRHAHRQSGAGGPLSPDPAPKRDRTWLNPTLTAKAAGRASERLAGRSALTSPPQPSRPRRHSPRIESAAAGSRRRARAPCCPVPPPVPPRLARQPSPRAGL